MKISRRKYVQYGSAAFLGTVVLGGRYAQQCQARSILQAEMMTASVPLLMQKASIEIESLPDRARQEIREYFHGICLNVHAFVDEVCSHTFAERLQACPSDAQKHTLLNVAFSQKIVTATEVLNRVDTISQEVGAVLDQNWNACCQKLADSWQTTLHTYDRSKPNLDLQELVSPLVRNSIEAAKETSYPLGQRPALSAAVGAIGSSAIMLLPVAATDPPLAFPLFMLSALKHLWDWAKGQISNRPAGYQTAISEQLAILGNRVGVEFEQEVRRRIADLHHWQEQSIESAARRKITQTIPAIL